MQSYGLSKFEDDQIVWDLNLDCKLVNRLLLGDIIFFQPSALTVCNFAAI